MKFFGPENYHPDNHTVTPVGSPCDFCAEAFKKDDKGVVIPALGAAGVFLAQDVKLYHESCNLRLMIGPISHLQKRCYHFGAVGTPCDDPPEISKREAAQLAVDYFVKPNKESSDA